MLIARIALGSVLAACALWASATVGPLTFQADTLSMSGQTGTLTLDSSGTTTNAINVATLNVGNSGLFNGSQNISLDFDLTLDGVVHQLQQQASWTISPSQDSVLAFDASGPVLFETSLGNWLVTLKAFSIIATNVGVNTSSVSAECVARRGGSGASVTCRSAPAGPRYGFRVTRWRCQPSDSRSSKA